MNVHLIGTRTWATDTNFNLRTADSTVSQTDTSITKDTAYHTWKWNANSSDVELNLDGTLEVTKTTNLPTTDLQPALMSWNENGNRDVTHIRYLECYNK